MAMKVPSGNQEQISWLAERTDTGKIPAGSATFLGQTATGYTFSLRVLRVAFARWRRFISTRCRRSALAVGPRRISSPSNRIQPVAVSHGTWSSRLLLDRSDRGPFSARTSRASSPSSGLRRFRYLNAPIACATALPSVLVSICAFDTSVPAKYRGPAHNERHCKLLTIHPRPHARRINIAMAYLSESSANDRMNSWISRFCNTSRQVGPLQCSRQWRLAITATARPNRSTSASGSARAHSNADPPSRADCGSPVARSSTPAKSTTPCNQSSDALLVGQTNACVYHYLDRVPTRPAQVEPERAARWARHRATVGARIRSLREARGFTQEALALSCGVSRNVLIDVEHGRRGLLFERLFDIAEALGVPVSDLFEGGHTAGP